MLQGPLQELQELVELFHIFVTIAGSFAGTNRLAEPRFGSVLGFP